MKASSSYLCHAMILAASAAAMLAASGAARAEYRCDAPVNAGERHACELARLDRPDELRRYVERTRKIYALYLPDYVSASDVERWNRAQAQPAPRDADVAAGAEHERRTRE